MRLSVVLLNHITEFQDGMSGAGHPMLNVVGVILGIVFILVFVMGILGAAYQRHRRKVRVRRFRAEVTVLSVGPEFARPLRKTRTSVEVAVMRSVTCRSEEGETIQVDLPYADWTLMPRGAKGVLIASDRDFISFKGIAAG